MNVDKIRDQPFANQVDSAMKERPGACLQHATGSNHATLDVEGLQMAPEAHNAPSADAQRFIDPIILHARLVNEAADLERRLAIRKALRPQRSEAARKGWEARHAR